MNEQAITYFYELKKSIVRQLRMTYPACGTDIHEWKGRDIKHFQADLMDKIQGRVSEKWFYTHIKPKVNDKLPRLDMLDMLCSYTGFDNWQAFVKTQIRNTNRQDNLTSEWNRRQAEEGIDTTSPAEITKAVEEEKSAIELSSVTLNKNDSEKNEKNKVRKHILSYQTAGIGIIGFLVLLTGLFFTFFAANNQEKQNSDKTFLNTGHIYHFCFIDADTKEAIIHPETVVQLIEKNETPIRKKCDDNGCIELQSTLDNIVFVVQSLYYKQDTIYRSQQQHKSIEKITLKTDDYALMIHIFSNSNVKDWQKRRNQLDKMIADDAQIIQVGEYNRLGMEMYNKTQFINKLTMPLNSLKNLDILETKYQNGQIIRLRFMQRSDDKNHK